MSPSRTLVNTMVPSFAMVASASYPGVVVNGSIRLPSAGAVDVVGVVHGPDVAA